MTKLNVLFSAIITAAVVFVANSASAQDLNCAMLASAGQPLPPYCAKQAAPAASQATPATPPAKATKKKSTTSTDDSSSPKPTASVEMTKVQSVGQPDPTQPKAAPVKVTTTTRATASNRVGAPQVEIVTTTVGTTVNVDRPASKLSLRNQNRTVRPRRLAMR